MTNKIGFNINTDRGTTKNPRAIKNAAVTTSAVKPTADTIRFKSKTLAKRHTPLYKPSAIKTNMCTGNTNKSVSIIVVTNCGGIVKLKRKLYAKPQANTTATAS